MQFLQPHLRLRQRKSSGHNGEGAKLEIAKKAKEWQADIMNCMAMISVHDTLFANIKSPSNEEIRSMRKLIGGSIHQMTHCSRCRADVCGKLCEG